MKNIHVVHLLMVLMLSSFLGAWISYNMDFLHGVIFLGLVLILSSSFFGWMVINTKQNEEFELGRVSE